MRLLPISGGKLCQSGIPGERMGTSRQNRFLSIAATVQQELGPDQWRGVNPVILTVKGKAAAIVQDAEAYQRLLDIAAYADAYEGIRQGLDEARQGRGRDIEEFFADFEARHGIPG
jgi:tripartite-type tricarboxylate transporter receptor subunit TctC